MSLTIALAGNPNCGKTTLFNRLTGANQYVGNWPGVTVERKEGKYKQDRDITIVDLPGTYSLSPYTLEERVARSYIIDGGPDLIIDIVDGTNLERNLYLSDQIRELGVPVIVAINMMDVVRASGTTIDTAKLSTLIGCPIFEISALKGDGVDELMKYATGQKLAASQIQTPFDPEVESALSQISDIALGSVAQEKRRWYAVKFFERDAQATEKLGVDDASMQKIEAIIAGVEQKLDDDSESLITTGRYEEIERVIAQVATKPASSEKLTTSDKIDRVVTNRILGLPIFVVIMFLVYYISVTTVGGYFTDWANDGLFGDGWFLGGAGRAEYSELADEVDPLATEMEEYENAIAAEYELDAESEDYADELEATIAAHPEFTMEYDSYDDESGENETIEVDGALYEEDADALAVLQEANPEHFDEDGALDPSTFGIWVPGIPTLIESGLDAVGCVDWLKALILDGIVAGVGAVLGFVPQMLVLFFLLAFLEGCGYMSRIAFVLDRVFRRFGLSGKSFIPILIGTGCGVPGVMASRTIENDNDRRMTVMTTTFIPCSAKLPIIALFAGALFDNAWWVAGSAYFLGVAAILCSGIVLKKTKPFQGIATPFVMELPAYHWPTIGSLLRSMWERAWSFIKKAGTLILVATILVWFLSGFGFVDGAFGMVEDQNDSLLAVLGGAIAWIFYPLGWGDWQAVSAAITGLIAKENVVGTLGVLYAGDAGWYTNLQAAFTPIAAYSFLAFNLLCAPCFAAMGAIKREMVTQKWFWAAIGYECGIAYTTALMIYQIIGLFIGAVPFDFWTIIAFVVLVAFLFMLFRPAKRNDNLKSVSSVEAAERA